MWFLDQEEAKNRPGFCIELRVSPTDTWHGVYPTQEEFCSRVACFIRKHSYASTVPQLRGLIMIHTKHRTPKLNPMTKDELEPFAKILPLESGPYAPMRSLWFRTKEDALQAGAFTAEYRFKDASQPPLYAVYDDSFAYHLLNQIAHECDGSFIPMCRTPSIQERIAMQAAVLARPYESSVIQDPMDYGNEEDQDAEDQD